METADKGKYGKFRYRLQKDAPLATSAEREVPRAGIAERLLSQSAHKCRALCPHKELQSAFIPFITSERMRYESLRADKRKTAEAEPMYFIESSHRFDNNLYYITEKNNFFILTANLAFLYG